MNKTIEFVVRSILIGAGSHDRHGRLGGRAQTVRRAFAELRLPRPVDRPPPRGRWRHDSIAKTAPIQGERLIGWCAHYSIGISFAALLLAVFGLQWGRSPTLPPALLVGIVTVVAPLFVLQPALGAGIASSKTSAPVFNTVKSLVTHTVFGVGLFLAARATASLHSIG